MVQYRSDIDGLRALAIGAVILFHAFPGRMPGGFIGVDIFFVISGYLISLIIFNGLERGNFDFFDFYSRRIRRIAPALVVILITCLALGWFILLSNEYKSLGKNTLYSAVFAINFNLLDEINYFDNASDTKPLLHLWSLGIEAQFYIAWCLLVWLAWKFRINFLVVIFVTTLLSFSLNLFEIKKNTLATFYLPQTRFWELLLGSGLAWHALYVKPKYAGFSNKLLFSNILSTAGLLLLFSGFILISKDRTFPGIWALLPTLGAFFIILAGANAFLNKYVLSSKIAVWFGLISYPLYLWHWPLLSFARIVEGETPRYEIRAGILMLSIVLAWLTYRFIEIPIRNNKHGKIKAAALLMLLLMAGLLGYRCYENEGYRQRSNASINGFYGNTGTLDWYQYITKNYFACRSKEIAVNALVWKGFVRCAQSKPDPNVQVALVGDSHAEHLFIGLAEAFPEMNIAFYIKSSPPFLSNKDFAEIFRGIQNSVNIKYIILAGYWIEKVQELEKTNGNLTSELVKVVDLLEKSGKKVYITDDVPAFNYGPEQCIVKRWAQTSQPKCQDVQAVFDDQKKQYLNFLISAQQQRPRTALIHLSEAVCDANICRMMINGTMMYRDSNHLSIDGSRLVGKKIRQKYPNLFD